MGFLLFDGCFPSPLPLHDVINLAFSFVSNKNKRSNKAVQTQQVRKALTDLFNGCVFHRLESMVTMSAVDKSLQTVSSLVSQAWHALEIHLIRQGMSAARLGCELVAMRREKRFLRQYRQCPASQVSCGLKRQ